MPESLRPLLEALREVETPRPQADEKARVIANVLARVDARLLRPEGGAPEKGAGEARGSAPPGEPAARVTPPPGLPSVDEVRAATRGEAPLGFEAWAALSIRFIGAGAEGQPEALAARRMTGEDWARIDDDYLRMLSADLRAGRTDRPALYAAAFQEELARRAAEAEARGEPGEAAAPMPVYVRAPDRLTGTGAAVDLPAATREAMGRMPFRPAPPGPPAPGQGVHGIARTQPVAVAPSTLGETMPLGGTALQAAVAAALPFIGSKGAASVVPFTALTVEQYVSLRVDLALRPGEARETLRRYGVPTEASHRALDAHWRQQRAERPEVRAALEAAMETYLAWLMAAAT